MTPAALTSLEQIKKQIGPLGSAFTPACSPTRLSGRLGRQPERAAGTPRCEPLATSGRHKTLPSQIFSPPGEPDSTCISELAAARKGLVQVPRPTLCARPLPRALHTGSGTSVSAHRVAGGGDAGSEEPRGKRGALRGRRAHREARVPEPYRPPRAPGRSGLPPRPERAPRHPR